MNEKAINDAIAHYENQIETYKMFLNERKHTELEEVVYKRRMEHTETAIEALKTHQPVTGETSDGYHTFDELYHHRAILFCSLCFAHIDKAWRSKKHHDGTMFGKDDDWFICGIETPEGQYTYHYRISEYWNIFHFCKTLDFAPEWDGHQPDDITRLLSLSKKPSWISVKDRLPTEEDTINKDQEVLCLHDRYGEIDTKPYKYLEDYEYLGITHWMPIPKY